MSPYAILGSSVGTAEAAALCVRLTAWHDAMVAHERRLRTGRTADACDDECPHDEARTLWTEALTTLGPRASELTFLQSRANGVSPSPQEVVTQRGSFLWLLASAGLAVTSQSARERRGLSVTLRSARRCPHST